MIEFLQSYGIWILLGLFFLLMLRGHGHGMCCGMGNHQEHYGGDKQIKANGRDTEDGRPSARCH